MTKMWSFFLALALAAVLAAGCGSEAATAGEETESAAGPEEESEAADSEEAADSSSNASDGDGDTADEPEVSDDDAAGNTSDTIDDLDSAAEDSDGSAPLTVQVPDLTKQIDSTDGTMRLYLPETWGDLAGQLNDLGDIDAAYPIKAGCAEEASFLMAAHEAKEGSALTDLTDFAETLLKAVSGNDAFSDVRRGGMRELTLEKSGLKACETGFSAGFEDQTIVYHIYAIEDENRYYQITAWSTGTNERTAEAVFDAIANTFEVLG